MVHSLSAARREETIAWLLEPEEPAVRHATLRHLLGRPADDPAVTDALAAAMASDPIAAILDGQQPEGYWEKTGSGYGPKYRSTTWQIIFLDQLGADGSDARVRLGCQYLLDHTAVPTGGFGTSGAASPRPPAPSTIAHCLNGNLTRALLGLGRSADERVLAAIEWQVRAALGTEGFRFYASATTGPNFGCAVTRGQPCAWGAVKALLAFARVPSAIRTPDLELAVERGCELLLSRDLSIADYPTGDPIPQVSPHWFKLGFPLGYVSDILQALEALVENGRGADPRLTNAVEWLVAQADERGRWRNELSYGKRAWGPFERSRTPSKWVTLRALWVLGQVEAQGGRVGSPI